MDVVVVSVVSVVSVAAGLDPAMAVTFNVMFSSQWVPTLQLK